MPKDKVKGRPPTLERNPKGPGLGPTQRALLASALPMMLVGMPAQVRLASREPQPMPYVPPKKNGRR
jgi:hypothetical protein